MLQPTPSQLLPTFAIFSRGNDAIRCKLVNYAHSPMCPLVRLASCQARWQWDQSTLVALKIWFWPDKLLKDVTLDTTTPPPDWRQRLQGSLSRVNLASLLQTPSTFSARTVAAWNTFSDQVIRRF